MKAIGPEPHLSCHQSPPEYFFLYVTLQDVPGGFEALYTVGANVLCITWKVFAGSSGARDNLEEVVGELLEPINV